MAPPGMKPAAAMASPKAHGGEARDAMAHEMGHGSGTDMPVHIEGIVFH
jgi:hypothetical protein